MSDEGFLRPEFEILDESSLIPDENLIRPAPTAFTHEVVGDTPFSYRDGGGTVGSLAPGAKVVLLREDDGGRCWVVDGRGLYVSVDGGTLRPLTR